MGKPMSLNLLGKGHHVTIYDISPDRTKELVDAGAWLALSSADAARSSDVTITMLPDGPDVEAAILGPKGVLEGARKGSTIVDMSSISPMVSRKLGAACEAAGVDFVDAPVSGGEPKAVTGTLAIMAGGKKEAFDRVRPILEAMGSSVTLTGSVGAGNVTKLANQIMVACNIAAMGEALVLATSCGVDPEVVFQAVRGGLAGSTVLEAKAPMVIKRNFEPGFRISLHQKDLRNALLAAESMKIPLPLTSAVQQMIMALMNAGKGNLDHSAIVTFLESIAATEIGKAGAKAGA